MSSILCGKDLRADVKTALSRCALTVTDSNLAEIYPEYTADAYVIPAGEKSKTPETLFNILAEMQRRKLQRGDRVAAFGGGVVGDITGLAAALYMRGIAWTSIPTSLLAMIDSGIGGKTAVDFNGVKNIVGAFHEPENIIISSHFLNTLPDREWLCGTGELVKTCLLSADAYALLRSDLQLLTNKDIDGIFPLIQACVRIKNSVVCADLTEKSLRKILNVGHTVGHALEALDGYRLSHGEYVIKGMMTESAMCRDMIDSRFYADITALFKSLTAPPRTTEKAVLEKALSDKKNVGGTVSMMIVVAPGDVIEVKLEQADFLSRYAEAIKELK